jgi:glucoside 3-dehydrogenase (cytochrome c) hitch-hiker subunit
MQRREVLKLLATAAASGLSPAWVAIAREAQAQLGSAYKLRTLSPQQNTMVVTMSDLIIPETDTPGAKGARVNEFIDVILTEWANDEERQKFLAGLADIDERCDDLFGKKFNDASVEQQTVLLRAMDDVAVASRPARRVRHGNTIPEDRDRQLQGNFWDVFKGLTLHGYYTSEIGFTQEERLEIIPGAYHGCVPIGEKKA